MIDSHCHLADEVFANDLDEVTARAREAGVTSALCILSADEPDEVARARRVSEAWPAVRYATAVHPHRAGAYAGRVAEAVKVTRDAAQASSAAAIGEIGLDYHYDFSPRDVQREVFAALVELAVDQNRPIVIHTREAFDDTLAVLREAGRGRARAVLHCFTGTPEEARRALDEGLFISMGGIVTFPKALSVRDVAAMVPPDRLLIETDAPFLAPVPHRGKRNEPAWVTETARRLAELRGSSLDRFAAQVDETFATFLGA
jgi:TatD DNase family protein